MYLLMSCLLWSLGVGALFGIVIRFVYFEIVLFKNPLAINWQNLTELPRWVQSNINTIEVCTWIFTVVAVLVLMGIILGQRHRIMEAYYPFFEGFLRYVTQNHGHKEALRQAFPKYFEVEESEERETTKTPRARAG